MLTSVSPSLVPRPTGPVPQASTPERVVTVQPPATVEQGVIPQTPAAPLTGQQVQALLAKRSELSRQLTSAQERRNDLAAEIRRTSGPSREGLEQRAAQLDQRMMQIEGDLAEVGRQLAGANRATTSTNTSTESSLPFGISPGQVTGISIVFTVLVLFPLALAMARNLWRRGSMPRHVPPSPESGERLERLEQAVDAIAIEIERVSEGQRFVTQILTRGDAVPVGSGQPAAEPLRARLPDPVRLSGERG